MAGTAERQLQGQSDYVMNFGITYINPQTGLSITTLFNQIGRRISEYGNAQYDNIYENPRPLFDAQVSIPFLKEKGSVKINVSDLLNKNAIFIRISMRMENMMKPLTTQYEASTVVLKYHYLLITNFKTSIMKNCN